MAGNTVNIIASARLNTTGGTIAVRGTSGAFDSAAWTRVAAGHFRCTLSGAAAEKQNSLDPLANEVLVTIEDTQVDRAFAAKVARTSATVFDVRTFSTTVGGAGVPVCALADPDTGFAVAITSHSPQAGV